ncbi:MAG: 4-hydroxy-tetrahydrodipicolinate reductase [bacterium]|nr:4-hydroxy-tetrahydrodipicolinate reductase [bacterium]MDD5354380.1 4-hydroxy-tetrahydrodipicolinate reductase [bacterium]MDD5756431.1 4-hydroxy-tetrahydrodipicolinate reductase [bacterium]
MIKVVICGAAGRMGQKIISIIQEEKDIKLVGAIEGSHNPMLGTRISPDVKIIHNLEEVAPLADVVVDFTSPKATLDFLAVLSRLKKPFIIGTTGFTEDEIKNIKFITQNFPCLLASNMSIGMNLLFRLVRDVAPILGDSYDVEIVEAHHNRKKDAPSGTAMTLAEEIAKALNRNVKEDLVYGRKGNVGERLPKEIGIHSIRGGDIVGDHTVIFAGHGERIELTHRASSRDTLARGVVRAIRFMATAKTGFYDMQDVLGLK